MPNGCSRLQMYRCTTFAEEKSPGWGRGGGINVRFSVSQVLADSDRTDGGPGQLSQPDSREQTV